MKFFIQYDQGTGEIKSRLHASNTSNAFPVMGYQLLEITQAEYDATPEVHKKVNLTTMELEDK